MVILIRCLRRVPTISRREFQEHWLQRATRSIATATHVRRSVQYHTVVDPDALAASSLSKVAADEPDYDGISAEWFDDVASLECHLTGDHAATEFAQEPWFIDHLRSTVQLGEPHLIFEPEDVEIVLLQCLKRRPDLDRAGFNRIWLEHAPLGFMMKDLGYLRGYYQIHWIDEPASEAVRRLGTEEAGWDGIVLSYFESIVAVKAMSAHSGMDDSYQHATTFLDTEGWLAMMTRRHVLRQANI